VHYVIDVPAVDELKMKAEQMVKEMPSLMVGS
jgi:hypothetical protein